MDFDLTFINMLKSLHAIYNKQFVLFDILLYSL